MRSNNGVKNTERNEGSEAREEVPARERLTGPDAAPEVHRQKFPAEVWLPRWRCVSVKDGRRISLYSAVCL